MIPRIEEIQNFDRRLANVDRIRQRIAEIENQIGFKRMGGEDFQTILSKELSKTQSVNPSQQPTKTQQTNQSTELNDAEVETFENQSNPSQQSTLTLPGDEALPQKIFSSNNTNLNTPNEPLEEEFIETPTRDEKRLTFDPNSTTEDMIQEAAYKYGIDSKLVKAIATAESNLNQNEISDAGAIGVMQLMPETAAGLGVDPYDEQQNIEGGAKYLKQMLDRFGGNIRNAVAAYNAGPGAVEKFGGVPPYGETQHYVGRVLDLYK